MGVPPPARSVCPFLHLKAWLVRLHLRMFRTISAMQRSSATTISIRASSSTAPGRRWRLLADPPAPCSATPSASISSRAGSKSNSSSTHPNSCRRPAWRAITCSCYLAGRTCGHPSAIRSSLRSPGRVIPPSAVTEESPARRTRRHDGKKRVFATAIRFDREGAQRAARPRNGWEADRLSVPTSGCGHYLGMSGKLRVESADFALRNHDYLLFFKDAELDFQARECSDWFALTFGRKWRVVGEPASGGDLATSSPRHGYATFCSAASALRRAAPYPSFPDDETAHGRDRKHADNNCNTGNRRIARYERTGGRHNEHPCVLRIGVTEIAADCQNESGFMTGRLGSSPVTCGRASCHEMKSR